MKREERAQRIINVDYGFVHGTYWMVYAVFCSFCSAYLLGKGYTNSQIGMVLAAGNVLSVVLQPLLADWADRSRKVSVFGVSQIVTVVITCLTGLLMAVAIGVKGGHSLTLSFIFVMIIGWQAALQPLINSLAFKLSNCGVAVNFGACRAIGSLAYALICWVLGIFAEKAGAEYIPLWGVGLLVMLAFSLAAMNGHFKRAGGSLKSREIGAETGTEIGTEIGAEAGAGVGTETGSKKMQDTDAHARAQEINLPDFIRRNRLFCVLNVGVGLVFFSNGIFNNFMLQIVTDVGGNSADMGGVFAVMAVLELPTLIFFEQIRKKFTCQTLIKVAALGFTARSLVTYAASGVAIIYAANIFQLVGFALILPSVVRFTAEIMSEGEAVKGQALYTSMVSVSAIFAGVVGGSIIDGAGTKTMLLVSTLVTIAGAVIVIGIVDKVKSK